MALATPHRGGGDCLARASGARRHRARARALDTRDNAAYAENYAEGGYIELPDPMAPGETFDVGLARWNADGNQAGAVRYADKLAPLRRRFVEEKAKVMRRRQLTATIEPFDSFWEAPEDIEKGYRSFYLFYKDNYAKFLPADKRASILCVSCGPGYGVSLLNQLGYAQVVGVDSFPDKIEYALKRKLNCKTVLRLSAVDIAMNGKDTRRRFCVRGTRWDIK